MNDEQLQWFKSLKAGDTVAVSSGYGRAVWRIDKVESVTPSGRVRIGHYEFNSDGSRRGSYSEPVSISPITDDIRDAMFRERAVSVLAHSTKWTLLTSDQLKRILDIVKESQP